MHNTVTWEEQIEERRKQRQYSLTCSCTGDAVRFVTLVYLRLH
jgi:hypothetical protein